MNPFEAFLSIKDLIVEQFGEDLRKYGNVFHMDSGLEFLGCGRENTHYRLGKCGGYWLAIREITAGEADYIIQRPVCEKYIIKALDAYEKGIRVPNILGGVLVQERCFLIVEDLTHNGEAEFVPAEQGHEYGTIDGERVLHDIDTMYGDNSLEYKYMTLENMIVII